MGLADVFVQLGVAYDSEEGVEFGRKIQQFVDEEGKVEAERLADERGVFPEWARSIWGPDETCARGRQGERVRPMRRCATATSPPSRPPGRSRSSPAAAPGSSRCSPLRSCAIRRAC